MCNVIRGGGGQDWLNGQWDPDIIYGDEEKDHIIGESGEDTVYGGTGNDYIMGGTESDWLNGQWDNDNINGESGSDVLIGEDGNDKLSGGGDADWLMGDGGRDKLYGQDGIDIFFYDDVSESPPGATRRDIIYDFASVGGTTRTEHIDLKTIDADPSFAGDQAFTFLGTAPFTSPGELRVQDVCGTHTLIQANISGTSGAEFEILVRDTTAGHWTGDDFLL